MLRLVPHFIFTINLIVYLVFGNCVGLSSVGCWLLEYNNSHRLIAYMVKCYVSFGNCKDTTVPIGKELMR